GRHGPAHLRTRSDAGADRFPTRAPDLEEVPDPAPRALRPGRDHGAARGYTRPRGRVGTGAILARIRSNLTGFDEVPIMEPVRRAAWHDPNPLEADRKLGSGSDKLGGGDDEAPQSRLCHPPRARYPIGAAVWAGCRRRHATGRP